MARRQAQSDLFSRATAAWKYSRNRNDSLEKCRERRRRRIQMRRSRSCSASAAASDYLSSGIISRPLYSSADNDHDSVNGTITPLAPRLSQNINPMPIFSTISVKAGNLCVEPELIFIGAPLQQPLHFFAVYHGHASTLYKELLHRFVVEELKRVDTTGESSATGDGRSAGYSSGQWPDRLRTALGMSFEKMERVALGACSWCIDNEYPCTCNSKPISSRLTLDVSAAVVAILTAQHIVVAHSGASRAVLCRGGMPISLNSQQNIHHKPQKFTNDQLERVHEDTCGPIPYHNNGVLRVYGNLDVSPPLEAEISITERSGEDECLILGSYGLWDVMSEDTACNVATICLRDGKGCGSNMGPALEPILLDEHDHDRDEDELIFPISKASAVDAAALLSRLALGRGSSTDTISVIVVDLKRHY